MTPPIKEGGVKCKISHPYLSKLFFTCDTLLTISIHPSVINSCKIDCLSVSSQVAKRSSYTWGNWCSIPCDHGTSPSGALPDTNPFSGKRCFYSDTMFGYSFFNLFTHIVIITRYEPMTQETS